MSLYDEIFHGRTSVPNALDAMAMGAKPGSDDRELFFLMARKVRRLMQELGDARDDVAAAWDALGTRRQDRFLSLGESISAALREIDGDGVAPDPATGATALRTRPP